jgi:hypothetical protein
VVQNNGKQANFTYRYGTDLGTIWKPFPKLIEIQHGIYLEQNLFM